MERRTFLRWAALTAGCVTLARLLRAAPEASTQPAADEAGALWRRALVERRVVEFSYHGHQREVEPHALGLLADGKRAVHAFQTAGASASEPPPGWRTFVVAEMKDVKAGAKTFARPRADYRRGALKTIEAEVAGVSSAPPAPGDGEQAGPR